MKSLKERNTNLCSMLLNFRLILIQVYFVLFDLQKDSTLVAIHLIAV